MKITKKNGKVVLFDEEKVVNSILRANAEVPGEEITRKKAMAFADGVFVKLTESSEIIRTEDVRTCVTALLKEKGFPQTAEHYQNYKK